MDPLRNLLVLTIDGLAARDLGAYGNTWIETPGFDRVASQAWLAETVLATRPDFRAGLWDLMHHPATGESVAALARAAGRTAYWISDQELSGDDAAISAPFDQAETLDLPSPRVPATAFAETHCAQFFARLLELRETATEPHLIWAHYTGLARHWDAPTEERTRLELDEEVAAPTWLAPPLGSIDPDREADRRLQILWAWAAQVIVVDRCMAALWEAVQGSDACGLVLTSPRGFPLGEHGQVGFHPPLPYGEQTQVPLLAWDGTADLGWRELAVQTTGSVPLALAARLAGEPWNSGRPESAPRQIIHGSGLAAVRQGGWFLVRRGEQFELYAKPDDRWEVNDVSQRCHDVVAELSSFVEPATD